MFIIDDNKTIHLTRGDIAVIEVSANSGEEKHVFEGGSTLRLRVFEKKACDKVVLEKVVKVEDTTETVDIELTKEDTKIGNIINKPVEYWYEIEANYETDPQTIIGYDADGPKLFMLYPESGDVE